MKNRSNRTRSRSSIARTERAILTWKLIMDIRNARSMDRAARERKAELIEAMVAIGTC